MHSRLERGRLLGGSLPNGTALLLIPAAALVVHQLRFWLTYGAAADAQLTASGHSYQTSVVPWVVLMLGIGLSSFLRRATQAVRSGETGPFVALSPARLWAITTVGLVAIYTVQESLEELYASGHPTGFSGIFGHGGWWAIPAAAVVAVGVVALLRLGRAVLRLAGRAGARRPRFRRVLPAFPAVVLLVGPAPLARAAAGRAPPHLLRAG
jgi:hypothetical protein